MIDVKSDYSGGLAVVFVIEGREKKKERKKKERFERGMRGTNSFKRIFYPFSLFLCSSPPPLFLLWAKNPIIALVLKKRGTMY